MKSIPQIFSLHKIIAHRNRAAKDFAQHSFLHDEIENRMIDRIEDLSGEFEKVLVLGYCSDELILYLQQKRETKFIVRQDYSADMGGFVVADLEKLPYAPESFDLIYSNSLLHLANDLPGVLVQIRKSLRPDGVFLASMFGGESLCQLRQAMSAAEEKLYGGMSPHIHPFVDVKTLGSLVQRAAFSNLIADSDLIDIAYDNAKDLMYDLRNMGEANSMMKCGRTLSRDLLDVIESEYKKNYTDGEGGILSTFDIINITGLATKSNG